METIPCTEAVVTTLCRQMPLSCSFLGSVCMCRSECFVHIGKDWTTEVGESVFTFSSSSVPTVSFKLGSSWSLN